MPREMNPYSSDAPEWQLWVNMISNEEAVIGFIADSERALYKADACREKARKYREALNKLVAPKDQSYTP